MTSESAKHITAILLVGGAASRMRPLSADIAKCMIPFMGQPLLAYTVDGLRAEGITDLVFTSGGKNGEIKDYFADGSGSGVNIRYHEGHGFDGTAGCVLETVRSLEADVSDPFMVVYGDSLLRTKYADIISVHRENDAQCTILYHRPRLESFTYDYHDHKFEDLGPRTNYGIMAVDSRQRMLRFEEKPLLKMVYADFETPLANATVYMLSKRVLSHIRPGMRCDFAGDLFPLLVRVGVPCYGSDIGDGYRLDLGTLATYYSAQMAVLDGVLELSLTCRQSGGRVWIGEDVIREASSELIEPVLLGRGAKVGARCHIVRSIIGNLTSIGESSEIVDSIVHDNACVGANVRLSGCIIGEHAMIDDNCFLPPGTVLGSCCSVGCRDLRLPDSDFRGLVKRD